jgi:hypothetical protein
MKIEIKNANFKSNSISTLVDYFHNLNTTPNWKYKGLIVELDPTIDLKGNNALIRWTDINENFNDKIIVNSLEEFKTYFKLMNA